MVIGQLLAPIHSLGPGNRIGLWTKGCSKLCFGCMSPEFQELNGTDIPVSDLKKLLEKIAYKNNCKGITISGGDPFEQSISLLLLLQDIRDLFEDILVYTGFTYDSILKGVAGKTGIECLKYIDVLIDGRYVRELNTPQCVLKGSENQNIIFLNSEIQSRYIEYLKQGRIIENFMHENDMIIVGILNEDMI